MTEPTPPFDLSAISTPLVDPAHEAMRATVLAVINEVWSQHLDLVGQVTGLTDQVAELTGQITALQDAVTVLQNPPAPL